MAAVPYCGSAGTDDECGGQYDDQLNNIEWAATLALEQNKEQQKDIYSLQKSSADYQFRIMELEWDVYDKR